MRNMLPKGIFPDKVKMAAQAVELSVAKIENIIRNSAATGRELETKKNMYKFFFFL